MDKKNKIGVLLPTFVRPDFVRSVVIQLLAQSVPPELICVHQNGTEISYDWCVKDLNRQQVRWLHSPEKLPQSEWYSRPLSFLIEEECTHFFWVDHDDMYFSNHIQEGMDTLNQGFDFSVNFYAGLLKMKPPRYFYKANYPFTAHGPGGMSSSMCFNRAFAHGLLEDLLKFPEVFYADNILTLHTMPRFRCHVSQSQPTTVYVCHENTVSSSSWLADADNWSF